MRDEKDIQFGALRIFATVAQAATLTQAAEQLGITQSAVSQAIAQLEVISDQPLIVRSKPIKLTPAGQVMRRYAERIGADTRRMLAEVHAVSDGALPHLAVGLIDSFGDIAGQRLIERIGDQANRLSLHTGYTAPLSQAFLDRDLDILVTSDPLEDHAELERHPLLRDPFVMLLPNERAQDGAVSPETLAASVPFVRYSRQSRLGVLTDLIARRMNLEPRVRYELDSTQTLLRFVRAGYGWAMATALCIVQYPQILEELTILPLGQSANARHLSLVARPDELGGLPAQLAQICRDIYARDVLPKTLKLMPWLAPHARAITDLPII